MLENHHSIRSNYEICKDQHYLASASITGMHKQVQKAHHEWISFSGNSGSIEDQKYFDLLQETRELTANFYCAKMQEVAFVANSSYAFNMMAMILKEKSHKRKVIIAKSEFPTTFLPWEYHGFEVQVVEAKNNLIDEQDYLNKIDEHTAAVICSQIFSFSGQKLDILKLGSELKQRNIPFFVNSTQAAGAFKLHWDSDLITGLTFSCHKRFGACMGTSVFLLKEEFYKGQKWPLMGWTSVEEPWDMVNIGTQQRNDLSALELGSMPFSNINGIKHSILIQKNLGIDNISAHIEELSTYLISLLSELGLIILTPNQNMSSGIVSFKSDKLSPEEIDIALKSHKIYLNQRQDFLRASVHLYNNKADIDALYLALKVLI